MTYTESLPDSETFHSQRIEWEPSDIPGRGVLTVRQCRGRKELVNRYFVAEFPADELPGRAVRMFKPEGDASRSDEPSSYDVTCTRDGSVFSCECKGFLRWQKPCKHVLALHALIESGELDNDELPVNPESDVENTEFDDQPEPAFAFVDGFSPVVKCVTPSIPWDSVCFTDLQDGF